MTKFLGLFPPVKTGLAATSVKRNWTAVGTRLKACGAVAVCWPVVWFQYLVLHTAIVHHAGGDRVTGAGLLDEAVG